MNLNFAETKSTKGMEYREELYWPSIDITKAGQYQCQKYYLHYDVSIGIHFYLDVLGWLTKCRITKWFVSRPPNGKHHGAFVR